MAGYLDVLTQKSKTTRLSTEALLGNTKDCGLAVNS